MDKGNLYKQLVAVFLSILIGLVPVKAAETKDKPLVLIGLEIPPYYYNDRDGVPKGLIVDLVEQAAEIAEVPVSFVVTNWPRAQLETKVGRADLIFPVVYVPEREDWLIYPKQPITQFEMMVFARKNPAFSFDGDTRQLQGLTIGKIANGRMHPKFRALEESGKARVEQRDSLKDLLLAVEHGRLDGFVAPHLSTLDVANSIGLDSVVPFETPIGTSNIYVGFSRKSSKKEAWAKLQKQLSDLEFLKSEFLMSLADDNGL